MPYFRIWIHIVLVTEDRKPLITGQVGEALLQQFRLLAMEKGILVDCVGGGEEHLHLLVAMGSGQSISQVVETLSIVSETYVSLNKLSPTPFSWNGDYLAFSVSHSLVDKVREYIKGQSTLHQRRSFDDEYLEFCQKHGFVSTK
ncbi:MAG TPA: transposase [Williamwhitmania sp.]|nr:transposase [Williamwhitmania sp.]